MQLDALIWKRFLLCAFSKFHTFSCSSIVLHSLLVRVEVAAKPLKVKVMLKVLISLLPYCIYFFFLVRRTHTQRRPREIKMEFILRRALMSCPEECS